MSDVTSFFAEATLFFSEEDEPAHIDDQLALVEGYGGQLNVVDELESVFSEDRARELTAEWIGLPAFGPVDVAPRLVVSFDTVEDRQRLLDLAGITTIHKGTRGTLSVWWPPREREDLSSLRFES